MHCSNVYIVFDSSNTEVYIGQKKIAGLSRFIRAISAEGTKLIFDACSASLYRQPTRVNRNSTVLVLQKLRHT